MDGRRDEVKEPETLDASDGIAMAENAEPYPWFLRLFSILCIVGGIDVIAGFAWNLIEFVLHGEIATAVKGYTATTIVIAAISLAASVALAVMYFMLGVRMLRRKRKRAALLCNLMITLAAVVLVCQFMIYGLNEQLIPTAICIAILIAVQSYSDPTLRGERAVQRKLRNMEARTEAEEGTLGLDTTGAGYIKLNFFNLFWIFVIVCIAGLLVELFWHIAVVDPGHIQNRAGLLYGPFSPIYGLGAVFMTLALNRLHNKSPILIFLVAAIIGGVFEFFVSWFFETAFGIVAWDYSDQPLNICGRTNAFFMCMWGFLGLVWVKVAMPLLLKLVNLIPWNWRYTVTVVCATLMFADCILSLAAFDCWYQREAGTMDYAHASAITEFCNDNFDNNFMANRFESMTMDPSGVSRVN